MIRPGDIAFSHPRKMGFYSKAVRFFTKSQWSHCFFIAHPYLGQQMVLEQDLNAQLVPWEKEYIEKIADIYEVYRPLQAKEAILNRAINETYYIVAGSTYGFLSIPWFAIRETLRNIFGFVLRKNFSHSGVICSELLIEYLLRLDGKYSSLFIELTPNETSPEDIYRIVKARPDLFELVLERK